MFIKKITIIAILSLMTIIISGCASGAEEFSLFTVKKGTMTLGRGTGSSGSSTSGVNW